jgi:hypothetical protein
MAARLLFRNIWRANAIIILAAGVLSLIVLIFAAFYVVKEIFRERDVTAVVNTDAEEQIQESLSLGSATQITGHPWLLIAVESDQKYDQAYFSKSATAARNYAFVPASGQTRWLYQHNRFLIVDATQLPGVEYYEQEKATALISFVVVRSDSDKDQRLTPHDFSVLMFTKPDGTGGAVVLENVRRIVSQEIFGEEILVVYESNSGYASSVFSLKDFSEVRHEKLVLPTTGS